MVGEHVLKRSRHRTRTQRAQDRPRRNSLRTMVEARNLAAPDRIGAFSWRTSPSSTAPVLRPGPACPSPSQASESRPSALPAASVRAVAPGAETIDASGQSLIPGLWDVHVHLGGLDGGIRAGPAFIAHGVTGVRDMGSPLDEILTLRDRWRRLHQGRCRRMRTAHWQPRAPNAACRSSATFPSPSAPPTRLSPANGASSTSAAPGSTGCCWRRRPRKASFTRRVRALLDAARQGDAAADAHLSRADLTGPLADSFSPQKAAALFRTFRRSRHRPGADARGATQRLGCPGRRDDRAGPTGGRPRVGPLPGDGPAHARRRRADSRRHRPSAGRGVAPSRTRAAGRGRALPPAGDRRRDQPGDRLPRPD